MWRPAAQLRLFLVGRPAISVLSAPEQGLSSLVVFFFISLVGIGFLEHPV